MYEDAIVIFAEISSFSDSAAQITECKYQQAVALMNEAQYEEALLAFEALGAYSDSEARITKCNNAILEQDYRAALSLLNEGKYGEAIEAFAAISGYKDADDKMTEAIDKKMAAAAREPFTRVGSIVSYGHYEQDNDTTNGMEPIEWIVLEYDSATERALLLSRYGLDTYRFDTSTYQSWDKSEIRAWLNSTFLNSAFTSVEYPGIVTTKVSTLGDNGNGDESDTNDKLWLLSQGEATTFFLSDEERKCTPTVYAVKKGAYQSRMNKLDGIGCSRWWLRSPGYDCDCAYVFYDGSVCGISSIGTNGCIRPAFWLDLNTAAIN